MRAAPLHWHSSARRVQAHSGTEMWSSGHRTAWRALSDFLLVLGGATSVHRYFSSSEEWRMALRTRLNEMLDIEHPIISAPMAFVAGGHLAATITGVGGLGLIGGGYGDAEWLEREFAEARNARV